VSRHFKENKHNTFSTKLLVFKLIFLKPVSFLTSVQPHAYNLNLSSSHHINLVFLLLNLIQFTRSRQVIN